LGWNRHGKRAPTHASSSAECAFRESANRIEDQIRVVRVHHVPCIHGDVKGAVVARPAAEAANVMSVGSKYRIPATSSGLAPAK
jgi:hypothetical protein